MRQPGSNDSVGFDLDRYEIDGCASDLSLERLAAEEADPLGAAFAAIDPWRSYPYPAADLARYFTTADPNAPCYAIRASGETVGVIGVQRNWLRGPYLRFLGVLPAHQAKGLGSAAVRWFICEATRASNRNAWVCASDLNAAALRFYEAHGFGAIAEVPDLVREGRSEILMRKVLFPTGKSNRASKK
jgi:GNAT superfamily N-acetyltransferase